MRRFNKIVDKPNRYNFKGCSLAVPAILVFCRRCEREG